MFMSYDLAFTSEKQTETLGQRRQRKNTTARPGSSTTTTSSSSSSRRQQQQQQQREGSIISTTSSSDTINSAVSTNPSSSVSTSAVAVAAAAVVGQPRQKKGKRIGLGGWSFGRGRKGSRSGSEDEEGKTKGKGGVRAESVGSCGRVESYISETTEDGQEEEALSPTTQPAVAEKPTQQQTILPPTNIQPQQQQQQQPWQHAHYKNDDHYGEPPRTPIPIPRPPPSIGTDSQLSNHCTRRHASLLGALQISPPPFSATYYSDSSPISPVLGSAEEEEYEVEVEGRGEGGSEGGAKQQAVSQSWQVQVQGQARVDGHGGSSGGGVAGTAGVGDIVTAGNTATTQRSPFQQALSRMEAAGLKIMCKRLSEDWSEADGGALDEVLFEQKLWALTARQWLTLGRPLQSPGHQELSVARVADGKRILNLHGTAADGWVLAAKYPTATVYSVSSHPTEPNTAWPPPLNHHPLYTSVDSALPFPANHFDVVSSRSFSSAVPSQDWLFLLRECIRVLKPSGWLELQTMDATLSRQGESLVTWTSRIAAEITRRGYSPRPSEKISDSLSEAGFENVKCCRIALPTHLGTRMMGFVGSSDPDAQKVMLYLGRNIYQELYGGFLKQPVAGGRLPWWWYSKRVRMECEKEDTKFGLMIFFGQKVVPAAG